MAVNEPAQKATTREWAGLAVIALACVLYVMDLTVLHLAVPAMSEELRPTSTELLWIIDIYGFMIAGSLIPMGTLGDRIGRRRLLMMGAAAFGLASVLAAFSTSAVMLIATRALLGLAGATLAPSTLSLIRNMFLDPVERTRAISIWITSFSVGGAIGPLLGGVVLQFFWWGAVFLLAVPVMALLLTLGPRFLPEYRDPNAGRPDMPSAALSLASVLAVIFGLKQIAANGLTWLPLASIAAGLALGILFVRRQRVLADPLIDLRLFQLPAFSASLALYGLAVFVGFGGFLLIPQFLQLVVGLSPLEAGLWTLPYALAFILGAQVTPLLVRRIPPWVLIVAGLIPAAAGMAIFTRFDAGSPMALFIIGTTLLAIGPAPLFTLTVDLIVGSAPPERAGAASGISETAAELGGAVGIAVFGSIGVAVYRTAMAGAGAGVPPEALAAAHDTLGGALSVSAQLPGPLGAQLLADAREAFTRGVQLVAALAAAGLLGLAVFAAATLRRVPVASAPLAGEPAAEEPDGAHQALDLATHRPQAALGTAEGDDCDEERRNAA